MTSLAPAKPEQNSRVDSPTGTHALARSIRFLRVLATRGEIGWRLSDIAAACDLDKGTAGPAKLPGLIVEGGTRRPLFTSRNARLFGIRFKGSEEGITGTIGGQVPILIDPVAAP